MTSFSLRKPALALMLLLSGFSAAMAQDAAQAEAAAAPSNWKKGLDLSLQFTQNYVSPNWYAGGNSSLAGLFSFNGWANYAKGKYSWDNYLDLKYGTSTTFTDDAAGRKFHVTDDMSKLVSKFGYQMKNSRWYFAIQGEFQTTLFNTYTIDTNERTSGPGSPMKFYLSPGFDYKYSNDKGTTISLFISPATYKLIYVCDTTRWEGAAKNISQYAGLKADTNMLNDFGGMVTFNLTQKFNDRISLDSKLTLYTNYLGNSNGTVGIEADWEITANFILYKLLTAKVSLHPRYDSTTEDGWNTKVQFKEFVSLGLAYSIGSK